MGVLTDIRSEFDEQNQEQIIYATTNRGLGHRPSLNRVAGRAAVMTGVGQRTLVASAFDEVGIDMVWREGPLSTVSPEEKWPEAQNIEFTELEIDRASDVGDILNIPEDALPRGGKLGDAIFEDIDVFHPRDMFLYVWKIPYGVGGKR